MSRCVVMRFTRLVLWTVALAGSQAAGAQGPPARHSLAVVAAADLTASMRAAPVGAQRWREPAASGDSVPILRTPLERELRAASHHAGWGAVLGTAVGLVAGTVHSRRTPQSGFSRKLDVVAYGSVGFALGMTTGAGVYVVRRVTGWRPAA